MKLREAIERSEDSAAELHFDTKDERPGRTWYIEYDFRVYMGNDAFIPGTETLNPKAKGRLTGKIQSWEMRQEPKGVYREGQWIKQGAPIDIDQRRTLGGIDYHIAHFYRMGHANEWEPLNL